MPRLFCFIDDTKFELDNFKANALGGFGPVEWVLAPSFEQAAGQIGNRRPHMFLLDLYGNRPDAPPRELPQRQELAALLETGPGVDQIYEGITSPEGEEGNLFLRRLHTRVAAGQRAFLLAGAKLDQGRAFGLANLASVREAYPWAAALAYSRKALYGDAHAFCLAGGGGVLQKPQGADPDEIAQATRQQALDLARACCRAVRRRLLRCCAPLFAELANRPELAAALGRALSALDGQGPHDPARLVMLAKEAPELKPAQVDAVMALVNWLKDEG